MKNAGHCDWNGIVKRGVTGHEVGGRQWARSHHCHIMSVIEDNPRNVINKVSLTHRLQGICLSHRTLTKEREREQESSYIVEGQRRA